MKRSFILIVLLGLLLVAAPSALAKSTVVAYPLSLLAGGIAGEYEMSLTDQMTLGVPVSFNSFLGISVFGVGAGARYYFEEAHVIW